jgi:hypothetical protein
MGGTEAMKFTFPEIHAYWLMGLWQNLALLALWLMLTFGVLTMGQVRREGWFAAALITVYGLGLIVSMAGSSRQKRLTPVINERFAVEFMLRTGYPPYPENIDVLQVKRTVAVRDQEGVVHLWSVKRKRDVFTIQPV